MYGKYSRKLLTMAFLFCSFFIFSNAYGQATDNDDYEIVPVKDILFDLGYGEHNLSFGFGFRYDFIGLSIGVTGFDNDIPNYQTDLRDQPADKDFEERHYTTICVSGDLALYYDINDEFSVFGNVGYYAQADTILAYYYSDETLYRYKDESITGVAFGVGLQYFISDYFTIGAAWHNKRGAYLQLGYYWL